MCGIDARRTLVWLAAALIVWMNLSFALAQEDLFSADQITPQEANYRTVTAERDQLVKEASSGATEYYPLTYDLTFEHDHAKFVRYMVSRGDEVKAGDVLAEFLIEASEADMAQMEIELERLKEETERGIEEREESLAIARAAVTQATDHYDKELARLALRTQEVELEQYTFRQEHAISLREEELAKEREERADNVLVAPIDGVILSTTYKRADDAVSPGEVLVSMYSQDVMLMRVDNASGGFRYNASVTVTVGNNNDRTDLTGRVVASNDLIEDAASSVAYIQLDPYDEGLRLRNPKAVVRNLELKDVLVVPRSAVTMENGKQYVTKLTDGMVQKRYVYVGQSSTSAVWILQGVSEGETLIID